MILAMLATALWSAETAGSPPALDTVAACYMKDVDLTIRDPAGKYVTTGLARLLVIEFKSPAAGLRDSSPRIKLFDPAVMMLNRPIVETINANNSYGFILQSVEKDSFAMIINEPEAGKSTRSAQLIRGADKDIARGGGGVPPLLKMSSGRCIVTQDADPDGTFENWKRQPESSE